MKGQQTVRIIKQVFLILDLFLKNEGKEVEREKIKRDVWGGGLPLNIFLRVEIFSSGVKKFSGIVWYGIILFDKYSKVHGEIMSFAIIIWLHVGRLHIEYVEFSLLCSNHRLYN